MKKLKRKVVALVLAISMAFCVTGCNSKEESTKASTNGEAMVGETVYPVEVTDSQGNVATITEEPQKIISVAPNITELIYELGLQDKLVGRSEYCDYPEDVLSVESVGTLWEPNLENIIALEPDVVFTSACFNPDAVEMMKNAGIEVVVLDEQTDISGVYTMIEVFGEVMNCNDKAADCISEMKSTISSVEEKVKDLDAPSVYYVIGYGEYGDYTSGGDTYAGNMLEIAGGDNIAKDISGWGITLEEIVEADPEIIVISEYMKDDFVSMEAYKELTAVKEGHVYTIDINMLDRQGYRNAQGIEELAKIFHPEAFE